MDIKVSDLNQLNNIIKLVTRDSTKFSVSGDEIPALTQMTQWLGALKQRMTEDLQTQSAEAKIVAEAASKAAEENAEKASLLDGLASQAAQPKTPPPAPKKKTATKQKSQPTETKD